MLSALAALATLASARAENVVIGWNQNPESDIVTYFVHYGTTSGRYTDAVDSGGQTAATLPTLPPGTYYCVVTAEDSQGLVSVPSDELSFVVQSEAPTISSVGDGQSLNGPMPIDVQFSSSSSIQFATVELWVGSTKIAATKVGASNSSSGSVVWQNPPAGDYTLTVKAFDQSGTEYDSAPITVHIVQPSIKDLQWISDGLQFTVVGAPGRLQQIYASDDLQTWNLLDSEVNASGSMVIQDTAALAKAQQFYRVDSQ